MRLPVMDSTGATRNVIFHIPAEDVFLLNIFKYMTPMEEKSHP